MLANYNIVEIYFLLVIARLQNIAKFVIYVVRNLGLIPVFICYITGFEESKSEKLSLGNCWHYQGINFPSEQFGRDRSYIMLGSWGWKFNWTCSEVQKAMSLNFI